MTIPRDRHSNRYRLTAAAICFALVVAIYVLWDSEPPPHESRHESGAQSSITPMADSVGRDAPEPVESAPAEQIGSMPATPDEPTARFAHVREALRIEFAATERRQLTRRLVIAGLSQADSERTADEFFESVADCLMLTLQQFAIEDATPFDEVLQDMVKRIQEKREPAEMFGSERFRDRVRPCIDAASQGAGLGPLSP